MILRSTRWPVRFKLPRAGSLMIGIIAQQPGGIQGHPELVPMQALFQEALLSSPGHRVAGGTDEILRNIIAERVLGLPGDVRVDKDVPFNALRDGERR